MKARVLISYHYFGDIDVGRLLTSGDEPADVWMDSGAFSAMTLGAAISVEAYVEWLDRWRGLYSAACQLDVIGDPVGTMRNLERMEALGASVLPVYHMRSDRWDIFDSICDNYGHACLGGMAGTGVQPRLQQRFLVHALRRARDRGSPIVFHALGMTSDTVLNNVPIYSSDCSTWASARRWGYYQAFDDQRGTMRDVGMHSPADIAKWGPLLRDHGMTDTHRLVTEYPHYHVADALATVAFARREAWIKRRLGPVPRPDTPDAEPGLRLYMCCTSEEQVIQVRRSAAAIDPATLRPRVPLIELSDGSWRPRPNRTARTGPWGSLRKGATDTLEEP